MPTLALTHEELEVVRQLCADECSVAYCNADIAMGLLCLGIQHKCFRASEPAPHDAFLNRFTMVERDNDRAEGEELDFASHLDRMRRGAL